MDHLPKLSLKSSGTEIPVFLISLEDQVERRRLLIERGVPSDWVKHFFPAADFRKIAVSDLGSYVDLAAFSWRNGRLPMSGEVGCALSHRRIADWLAASSCPMALVLEDDIIPTEPEWLARIEATAGALLAHARKGRSFICQLGGRQRWVDLFIQRRVVSLGGHPEYELFLHLDNQNNPWTTHAYILSRQAAVDWKRRGSTAKSVADDWIDHRRRGLLRQIFYVWPPLMEADTEQVSTIGYREPPPTVSEVHEPFFTRIRGMASRGELLDRAVASGRLRADRAFQRLKSRLPYRLSK